jgi:hypothetical protein
VREVPQAGRAAGESRARAHHLDRGVGAQRLLQGRGVGVLEPGDVLAEQLPDWSIGSIRYYFPNKDELVASALWRAGERVDERIRRRTAGGMTMNDLRIAAAELLPLDADRHEMSLV